MFPPEGKRCVTKKGGKVNVVVTFDFFFSQTRSQICEDTLRRVEALGGKQRFKQTEKIKLSHENNKNLVSMEGNKPQKFLHSYYHNPP